jgi:CMP-N,N'-diacetyllegionaminic acid synthase
MIKNNTVLVVITARGGSKGLPGKNIKMLGSKPLIAWTIEAAKNSKYVDRIIVTSDSEDIIDVSRKYGAEAPFVRPPDLSGDLSKQEDAILHAMDWVAQNEKKYSYVMLLDPTCPFRDEIVINEVVECIEQNPKAKSVLTVKAATHHPLRMNILPEDHSLKGFTSDEVRFKNRQELPVYYELCGSACIAEWEHFKEEGSFITPLAFACITDEVKGHDIDTLQEFLLAEVYLKTCYH